MKDTLSLLGNEAEDLLSHRCAGVPKESLALPGPDFVGRVMAPSDRPAQVLRNLQALFGHGRLAGTGYLSILPVDQGVEHSAAASFAPHPAYFDPENLARLALEGGCSAFASTAGALGLLARKYAHRIPFIAKLNHNEMLTYPNRYDQIFFAQVRQAWDRRRWAPPCISARRKAPAKSRRFPRPSPRPIGWAWPRCFGPTCATRPSRRRRPITISRPI
jgi:class I fructose-bisphosphate aldolase